MQQTLEPAVDPAWAIYDQDYDPLGERGIESRFAIANGFLGVRGVPTIGGSPMWISWPRSYVAGLFATTDIFPRVPALVSAPDWVRVAILVNGEPLLRRKEDLAAHRRTLDMQRGMLLTKWRSSTISSAIFG
jgi:trehalose/maltose hydrolase-like predicted phosphorylase